VPPPQGQDDGSAPMRKWTSYTPDGRQVLVRREAGLWKVDCGSAHAESTNLDVALATALRSDPDFVAHAHGIDFPTWIREQADAIDPKA
jgi:hypothetical protein